MTDKELKKLKRAELLQLLVTQSREIDRLRNELDEANRKLEDRNLGKEKVGSLAEASLAAYSVIENTQKAADLYLENVKRRAEELLSGMTPDNAHEALESMIAEVNSSEQESESAFSASLAKKADTGTRGEQA